MRVQLLCLFIFFSAVAMAEKSDLVEKRLAAEQKSYKNRFVLVPHKTNYILPLTYQAHPNDEPYQNTNTDLQHAESKFQFSFKVPVTRKTLFKDNGYLYFSYTAQSLWQAFNTNESSPFRDTNHEPEIFLSFLNKKQWHDISMPVINVGVSHQSNGQSGAFSRSWNRVYVDMTLHYDDWYLNIKPWWRVPESEKRNALDVSGDDNPDIHQYYGYGEIRAFRQLGDNEISVMLRNNLHGIRRSAVEINYSYPLTSQVLGYIQVFHGYGETLIDYNHSNTRIGFGFMFNNWL
jgi:phospholipase A1/A2